MKNARAQTLIALAKGLLCAIALTLALMALVAVLAVKLRIGDDILTAINQVMKLASILLGVTLAVGRGGKRGFLTGMTVAALYMALGYGCYAVLGGNAFDTGEMLGEILIGAAVGAVAGAVLSNLPQRRSRRTA